MPKYSTWDDIFKNKKIYDIQDPIIDMELSKDEFGQIYADIVAEIQGADSYLESYMDYYFVVNPVRSYVLSFRGEKEKSEFYNIGLEKKSVLSLTEVHEGEDKLDKEKRKKNIEK